MKQKISITIDEEALRQIDNTVDNIMIRNRSQAIEHLVRNALGQQRTAVLLAGGSEEEVRISAKEYRITAKINQTTVIERAIRKLRPDGFKDVYIVARHNILTAVFDIVKDGSSYGVKITYIEEQESKGTAATLKLVKSKINSRVLVIYGHILFDKVNLNELWSQHTKNNAVATIMLTTSAKPSERGTVKMEGNRILQFLQKPKESDIYLVASPVFIAEPELLDYEGDSLEYNIFPSLAERGLLYGHMSSEREQHIHSLADARRLK